MSAAIGRIKLMRDFNPTNNQKLPGHDHLSEKYAEVIVGQEGDVVEAAQIIDINDYLRNKDEVSEPNVVIEDSIFEQTIPEIKSESSPAPLTFNEKRLNSIFAVAIGSVIFGAIYPAVNNMENQTVQEGSVAGLASFLGWGIFYVSIPYLQDSKLGRYFAKKDKKINN